MFNVYYLLIKLYLKSFIIKQEWDKRKGHYQPGDKMYYPKSKQRFRSLLYKLTKQGYLMKLKSDEKFKKIYRIGR